MCKKIIKQVGLGDNAFYPYLEGTRFEFRLGHQLSWLKSFMLLPLSSWAYVEKVNQRSWPRPVTSLPIHYSLFNFPHAPAIGRITLSRVKFYVSPFKGEAQTALFKDPVRTAQWTLFISIIKTNQFML
jgi:hypothetical protein